MVQDIGMVQYFIVATALTLFPYIGAVEDCSFNYCGSGVHSWCPGWYSPVLLHHQVPITELQAQAIISPTPAGRSRV